jgi:uncharacterized phiE125 gp8 family phage protein
MPYKVVSNIATIPLDFAAAKLYLRYTGSLEDGTIQALIDAAEQYAENRMWRKVLQANMLWTDSNFPADNALDGSVTALELPRAAPLVSVTAVKYYDDDGVLTTMSPADYQVDLISSPGRIRPVTQWPKVKPDLLTGIEVTYVAGYTFEQIPPQISLAMQMLVAHFFANRGDAAQTAPMAANALLDMYSLRMP